MVYDVGLGKESRYGSLLLSYMEQVMGVCCMGRRGGETGDGGCVLSYFSRVGELRV